MAGHGPWCPCRGILRCHHSRRVRRHTPSQFSPPGRAANPPRVTWRRPRGRRAQPMLVRCRHMVAMGRGVLCACSVALRTWGSGTRPLADGHTHATRWAHTRRPPLCAHTRRTHRPRGRSPHTAGVLPQAAGGGVPPPNIQARTTNSVARRTRAGRLCASPFVGAPRHAPHNCGRRVVGAAAGRRCGCRTVVVWVQRGAAVGCVRVVRSGCMCAWG